MTMQVSEGEVAEMFASLAVVDLGGLFRSGAKVFERVGVDFTLRKRRSANGGTSSWAIAARSHDVGILIREASSDVRSVKLGDVAVFCGRRMVWPRNRYQ